MAPFYIQVLQLRARSRGKCTAQRRDASITDCTVPNDTQMQQLWACPRGKRTAACSDASTTCSVGTNVKMLQP
jgi:hypothetical protein